MGSVKPHRSIWRKRRVWGELGQKKRAEGGEIRPWTCLDFANDLFPRLLKAGERFVGYKGSFYWSEVGTLEAYRQPQHDALLGKVRVRIPGKRLGENLWVDGDARLHRTAIFEGPVVIGRDAVIGWEVTLIGSVALGSGCRVRPEATVKNSVLLPGSRIGDGAYLEGCIVGPGYGVCSGERIRGESLSHIAC